MNSFSLALNREAELRDYYSSLAEKAVVTGVKSIFFLLAADEQRHYQMIQALAASTATEIASDSSSTETAKGILETFRGDTTVAARLQTDLAAYEHALAAEMNSMEFYEHLIAAEADSCRRKTLEIILAEERKHYSIVENLYEYVLKPSYYLNWVEFGNLRDL